MTCPARFCTDRLGALATAVSPVSFKPPQKWQYPFTRTQMESYSKNDSVVETPRRGEFASNFLSCPLDFVHKIFFFSQEDYDYLRAQRISGVWMSSKVCILQYACDSDRFYAVMLKSTPSVTRVSQHSSWKYLTCDWYMQLSLRSAVGCAAHF